MTLLPLVLAAHFLGDWVVQTDWQAANKVRPDPLLITRRRRRWVTYPVGDYWTGWRAMWDHMVGYHLALCLALLAAAADPTKVPHRWAWIVAGSFVTHSVIDRRWTVRWLMDRTGSAAFASTSWGVMAVDQALHLSILCVLAATLG